MTNNYPGIPGSGQDFSYPDHDLSDIESTHILKSNFEKSPQVLSSGQKQSLDLEWTQYFTEVVRCIRRSLKQEDILETATEEVRRLLGCERVVVYGLNQDSEGVIIAESVAPGFIDVLGRTIKDPCFETRYIEKYQNGRVKAIDNIYEANLTDCYIEQLEKLDVKANLVAPIINEGNLLGLLVAHQCSQPRYWQEHEVKWFSQIAMQVGFALDNAKLLVEATNLRQQTDTEAEWTQHFTSTVRLIRTSLRQEDILETATEEVRRLLACERVVVYGLSAESEGIIIAESVAPGFVEALGITIKDPCFEAKYIEKYQNGRVKATNNIYKANLTSCYIEQLEKLEVKANLVAPIINEGKLLGLFVAHQCSQPRNWQEHEIRWFSQIAMQIGFALDNAKVLVEAANLRQQTNIEAEWTQHFTNTVRLIRTSLRQEDILETATEEVRRVFGCDRVVVYGLRSESEGLIIAESVAPGFLEALGRTIKDPCFEAKYIEKYQNGRVKATNNIYKANLTSCYIEQLEKLEVKANLVAPIINEGKILGLFVAHQCSQPRNWQEHEIRCFSQIAMQVGFALDNAKLLLEAANMRQQSDTETEWTHYFSDTVKLIRTSLKKEDILENATEQIQRVLECDRVVVYGLNAESEGIIISESVIPGLVKTIGMTIKDPCFEARYIEKYQNGRVKATNNIYEANLTSCYIEQLEKLAVKANLVAPVINEGKLLGLLVAHQCFQPRDWKNYEIRWFSQIAMQVGFALDNATVLAESASLRQQSNTEAEWTDYFTNTVRLIRTSLTKEDILETATEEVRRLLVCERVLVYGLNPESEGVIISESVAPGFFKALGTVIKDPCFEAKYIEKYQNGRVKATNNIYKANLTTCYIEQLEKLGAKANLVAPIINEGKLLGLLVAHQCSQPREWEQHEIRWFSQIAMQVGFALDNAKVLAEAADLRRQADLENEWTQHFTNTVRLIRTSLNQEDILKTSVKEVRRVMNCDRVVLYGLNQESQGVITAESVAPGSIKTLGMKIKDPCFEAKYIEKYENGRVKATNNIYEANLTSCYIQQLEKLGVKANLVAPIINEGKILGLFVAHQCSQPRDWQDYEIRWFSQIAMQLGFALDNAKVLAEAASLLVQADTETKWTQYFTDTVRLIRQSLNRDDILQTSVKEVRRVIDCERVVVYGLKTESEGMIIAESVAPRFTKALGTTIKDPCFEAKYIEKYQNGRVRATNNIHEANLTPCYIRQLEKLGVKANLVAPILNEGKLLGLLVAHQCSQPRDWQQHEIRWFSQIAMQVGFALDNAKLLTETTDLRLRADKETEWTQYFTDTVRSIRQSLNREDILKTSVKEARRIVGCDRVVVYGLDKKSQGAVIAESVAPRFTKALGMIITDPCFETSYIEKYQNGRVRATDNIYTANLTSCYIEQLKKLEVKANLVAPILNEGKLLGLLVAHQCSQPRHWQNHEVRWFSQIAMQVGFALDNAKALETSKNLDNSKLLATHRVQTLETSKFVRQNQQTSERQQTISVAQQEELRQVLVEILQDNQTSFKDFSAQALNLSNSLATSLKEIKEMLDAAKTITTTGKLTERQIQRNEHLLQEGLGNIKSTLENIYVLQEAVADGGIRVKEFNQHCQKLSNFIDHLTDNLAKGMKNQSINVAIAESYLENCFEDSVTLNTKKVHMLREQLFEITSETQPLLNSAIAKTNEIIETMETETKHLTNWTKSLQTTEQKLDYIVSINTQVGKLVGNITQTAESQAQNSGKAERNLNIANKTAQHMLEQSQHLAKWFTQLAIFSQGNIQKISFWKNIKGFVRSSHTLVTFFTPKE
ncbi:GAF domain-containing protein [Mastigocoleus testarum]|uniref:Phytochrome chromophore attachment site domain-containing protein n=1 Tax=Mastigocoleus testarum BC008 TaxID=371196 RepID=A0A0V7ZYQ6_9CYAN|nr:GAF domain-containing protein [Mastigocoleus testarum]KST69640.1 hypothetical protein BC008_04870 [Mastigocoleus testarum BC008]